MRTFEKSHTRIKNDTPEKRTHEEKQRATDFVKCCFQHHISIYFKNSLTGKPCCNIKKGKKEMKD